MKKYRGKQNIGAWAAQFDSEGYLWFSDFNYGGLYKCDTSSKAITLEHIFEGQDSVCSELHSAMMIKENSIILSPLRDNYVRIYSIDTKKESKIPMPEKQVEYNTVFWGDKLYFLSNNALAYCFELEKMEFDEDPLLTEALKKINSDDMAYVRIGSGDSLTIWNEHANLLADISDDEKRFRIIEVDKKLENIRNAFHLNRKYWFIFQNNGDVISRDDVNDIYTEYSVKSFEYVSNKNYLPYSLVTRYDDKILLPNYYGRYFMVINESEHSIKKLFDENESGGISGLSYGACYWNVLKNDQYLYCIPQRSRNIVKCDKELNVVDLIPMSAEVDDAFFEKIIVGSNKNILIEDSCTITIENLVKYLNNNEI